MLSGLDVRRPLQRGSGRQRIDGFHPNRLFHVSSWVVGCARCSPQHFNGVVLDLSRGEGQSGCVLTGNLLNATSGNDPPLVGSVKSFLSLNLQLNRTANQHHTWCGDGESGHIKCRECQRFSLELSAGIFVDQDRTVGGAAYTLHSDGVVHPGLLDGLCAHDASPVAILAQHFPCHCLHIGKHLGVLDVGIQGLRKRHFSACRPCSQSRFDNVTCSSHQGTAFRGYRAVDDRAIVDHARLCHDETGTSGQAPKVHAKFSFGVYWNCRGHGCARLLIFDGDLPLTHRLGLKNHRLTTSDPDKATHGCFGLVV